MEEKNKDPDLGIVIRSFKEEIKVVFKPFIWIYNTTRKFKLLILVCGLVGVAGGVLLNYNQRPYYRASVCFSHQRISDEFCYEMTRGISELVGKRMNDAYLAKKLFVGEEVIQNLKSINHTVLNQNLAKYFKDSSDVTLPFRVEVETYDINSLDTLQKGLLRYYETNEFATKLKEVDLKLLAQKVARINEELKEIDSLKRIVSKSIIPRSTGTGIILGEPINPMSLYNSSSFFYDRLEELNRKELMGNSFYVVVGFSENAKPASMGRISFLAVGFLLGWILGLIIASFKG